MIFGGVEAYPCTDIKGMLGYKTIFYRGSNIANLKKFAEGPEMVKNIRLIQLWGGNMGVFTRLEMEITSRGKIGYIMIISLKELNPETIRKAKILNDHFIDEGWGGANELHLLDNGLIGVMGHIACSDDEGLHDFILSILKIYFA